MSGTLELLIEALNRNTEALLAANGSTPAAAADTKSAKTTSTKSTKTTSTKPAGPKHTKAETTEVVVAVKDTIGVDAAKKLLADHGFKKVADITEDKFDVLFDEGKALLDAQGGEEEAGEDDI